MTREKKFKLALATLLAAAGFQYQSAWASVPDEAQCIDMKTVVVAKPPDDFFSTNNLKNYLPPPNTLTPTTNQDQFITQFQAGVGQKIGDTIVNGPMFKQSSIGKFSNDVQKATSKSLIDSSGSNNGGVPQKVNFNVKAVQRTAELVYSGYFNSTVSYVADSNNISVAISKPLDQKKTTTLSLTNVSAAGSFAPNSMLSLTHSF